MFNKIQSQKCAKNADWVYLFSAASNRMQVKEKGNKLDYLQLTIE